MNTSAASMNSYENIFGMRVKRLTYQSESSPFGLWTLPNQVDGPSFAPCYAPYGEQSPPISSRPSPEQSTAERAKPVKSNEPNLLKPWEKGTKSGKRVKKGRRPKISVGRNPASDVAGSDMSSYSSSNSSFENSSSVSSNATSMSTTSTRSSSQNSPASRTGWYPVLDVAQHAGHPTAPILARPTPYNSQHPDIAQAAIALSRSTSIDSGFMIYTDTGCAERKHDRFEKEAPASSTKMHKRE